MMAMKRLDQANIPETEGTGKSVVEVARFAASLVRWFKNYRDFVVQGAWYPDEVFCDQGSSHGMKYTLGSVFNESPDFIKLPDTMQVFNLIKDKSALYQEIKKQQMTFSFVKGNVCDRCDAMAHTIVDNFKIQYREEKGNPISPSSTHMAMRFYIMSHYIADTHMPLHCDARSLNTIHAAIEKSWEDQVKKSYNIDSKNNRFFYNPAGFPLATDKMTSLIKAVEEDLLSRPFVYSWGSKDSNTRDYITAVSHYSFLLAHEMVPESVGNASWTSYQQTEAYQHFEEYSAKLLADAVDSIARAWLHVWIRYREWGPDKPKEGTGDNYSK